MEIDAATKRRARCAVNAAVQGGRLPRLERCSKCGASGPEAWLEYHHPPGSYAPGRWLDVVALCGRCHKQEHPYTWRVRDASAPPLGRPRSPPGEKLTEGITVRLSPAQLATLDSRRGAESRSAYLARMAGL